MKKKKYGKKIINWHRPLGKDELGKRYLRNQYFNQLLDKNDEFSFDTSDVDDYWDYGDPFIDDPGMVDDLYWNDLSNFLSNILEPNNPFENLIFKYQSDINQKPLIHLFSNNTELESQTLEFHLGYYFKALFGYPKDPEILKYHILNSIPSTRDLHIIKDHYSNNLYVAQHLTLFAPFWIRKPSTWNRKSKSLIDHLLVKYEVPEFLYSEWNKQTELIRFKWIIWFIIIAQGGSLKRVSKYFDWVIPPKLQQNICSLRVKVSPLQACMAAEIVRLGGNSLDISRILSRPSLHVDLTEKGIRKTNRGEFWYDIVQWAILNNPSINDEQFKIIISWATHKSTEAWIGREGPFQMKGRSLQTVLERSYDYSESIKLVGYGYHWRSHEWDWSYKSENGSAWDVAELINGEQLYYEGKQLNHCVSSYVHRCKMNTSAIFSIRKNEESILTVEINPKNSHIVQIRGLDNRQANSEELDVVKKWRELVVCKKK